MNLNRVTLPKKRARRVRQFFQLLLVALMASSSLLAYPAHAQKRTTRRFPQASAANSSSSISRSATPNVLLLNEDFNAVTTIPNGWRVVNNKGNAGWVVEADVGGGSEDQNKNDTGGSQNFAVADSDESRSEMDSELRSPTLNFSTAQKVQLKFKTRFENYTPAGDTRVEKADVDVSSDDGTSWTNVWRKTADYIGSETVDISTHAAGKNSVVVRFRYYDANYDYFWKIDDVQIDATAAGPAAPTGLTATADGQTRIKLAWTDASNNETGFKIERSPNGSDGWVEVRKVGADTSQHTDTNLTCGTTYHYRVSAENAAGASPSNIANAKTEDCPAVTVTEINESFNGNTLPAGWSSQQNKSNEPWRTDNPYGRANETGGAGGFALADSDRGNQPGADMDVELRTPVLNFTGKNAVSLEFRSRLATATGFPTKEASVAVSKDSGATWNQVWRWQSDKSQPGEQIKLDISQHAANQANVMVRFRYVANDSLYWEIDDVKIAPLPLPAAPTALNAALGSNSEPILTWTGNGAKAFEVWRSTNANENGAKVADVTNGAVTYTDNSAASNTTYHYRVRAKNAAGTSAFSDARQVQVQDRSKRNFDLTISLYRPNAELTPVLRQQYEEIIRYSADAVYEMSNGAHRLRRVEFIPKGGSADTADVKWTKTCHPSANVSGYGRAGLQIKMCDLFPSTKNPPGQDYLKNPRLGGWGSFGHEWGHYALSLYDEYKGADACDPNKISTPCNTDQAVTPSVMHQGDFADSRSDLNWLNISYAAINTQQNAHHRVYGVSAWETVARPLQQDPRDGRRTNQPARLYYPELAAVAPQGNAAPRIDLDINNLANSPSRAVLNIVWKGITTANSASAASINESLVATNGVRQIVIDRSSATLTPSLLKELQASLHQLIDRTSFGDAVGFVGYDEEVTTIFPITVIDSPASREAAHAAIDSITIGSEGRATGTALQTALAALNESADVDAQNVIMYLMGSGETTTGPYPTDVIPAFHEASVGICTFGLNAVPAVGGDEGGVSILRTLASQTNGGFAGIRTSRAELNAALIFADSLVSPVVDLGVTEAYLDADPGQTIEKSFEVDPSLEYLEFEVDWFGTPDWASVSLIAPDDTVTSVKECDVLDNSNPNSDESEVNTKFLALTACFTTVENPAPGTWTMRAKATDQVEDYLDLYFWVGGRAALGTDTFKAFAELVPTVDNAGSIRSNVQYPEPAVVNAYIAYEGGMVAGAVVTATVDEPDGSYFNITLRDDGADPDAIAGDGMYAGVFAPGLNGIYGVTVYYNNKEADAQISFTGLADTHDLEPVSINHTFERIAYIDVPVSGAPTQLTEDGNGDAAVLLTTDNKTVAGRINGADDFTVYSVQVPEDYAGELIVRVDNLALGMDPYVIAYNEAETWERIEFLETEPTDKDFLAFQLFAEPGETISLIVLHYDSEVEQGTYNISVGPRLSNDESVLAQRTDTAKVAEQFYFPIIR